MRRGPHSTPGSEDTGPAPRNWSRRAVCSFELERVGPETEPAPEEAARGLRETRALALRVACPPPAAPAGTGVARAFTCVGCRASKPAVGRCRRQETGLVREDGDPPHELFPGPPCAPSWLFPGLSACTGRDPFSQSHLPRCVPAGPPGPRRQPLASGHRAPPRGAVKRHLVGKPPRDAEADRGEPCWAWGGGHSATSGTQGVRLSPQAGRPTLEGPAVLGVSPWAVSQGW